MITGFEVGALFRLVDEISPGLRTILSSVRELNREIKAVREQLTGFGDATMTSGISRMTAEIDGMAAAWARVNAEAALAARTMAGAARSTAGAAAATSVPGAAGGGRHQPGWISGASRAHIVGPGIGLPGGSHVRVSGTAAMVTGGVAAYAGYEAAEMEDKIWWMNYHARRKQTKENNDQFRKIIEDAMVTTSMSLKEVAEAATDEIRMFQGVPGVDPIAGLPKFLRAAAFEAKAKGVPMKESMKSIIGMAHMVKAYDDKSIDALLPSFAYLSIANPQSLGQMERAFSYAVPTLTAGADVDYKSLMLLGTSLATAGVGSTKSGTWIREMVTKAMPGDPNTKRGATHNEMLKQLGLLDENGKPTWFTNGKPDPTKMLEIAGPRAAAMPPEERLTAERSLFGAQGQGAFSVLGNEKVLGIVRNRRNEMESEGFANQYESALSEYQSTTHMAARQALQEFNVLMIELGTTILPGINGALRDFKSVLEAIRNIIPGTSAEKWRVGTRGLEGAAVGAGIGLMGGPLGVAGGAAVGGIVGMGIGALQGPAEKDWKGPGSKDWKAPDLSGGAKGTGKSWWQNLFGGSSDASPGVVPDKMSFLQGPNNKQLSFKHETTMTIDGRQMAQVVSDVLEDMYEHPTGSPSPDGLGHFRPQGNFSST